MNSGNRSFSLARAITWILAGTAVLGLGSFVFGSTIPQTSISSVPMTMVVPAHPQVLLAIGNSQSMDGDLSGAIMTGSGTAATELLPSSSPLNYAVPSGFTPPCNSTITSGQAPYTINNSGTLCDNSASRLNVAKQALQSVLNTYAGDTDFGLLDYKTGSPSLYTTWVYYMSGASGFTFASSNTTPLASGEYVPNPCYSQTGSGTVGSDCGALQSFYSTNGVSGALTDPWMIVQYSSDDPTINDVLYSGSGIDSVCMVFGRLNTTYPYPGSGPNPVTPYPPNYTLGNYENGSIAETYKNEINSCAMQTGPTNAGFVPYQPQTMYAQRGFGYYTSVASNTGNLAVPMTSAGMNPTPAQVQAMIANFTPYLAPETSDTGSSEIKALAGQSPMPGMLAKAYSYYTTGGGPSSSNGCTAERYVIFVTDGLPTMDLSGNNWPPLGSAAATGYSVTATFNSDGSLASTNDQALTDTITELTDLNNAGIKTYIVGVGAGVDPGINPQAAATLTAMAIAGGTNTYFPATSAQQVTVDLQTILTAIQAGTYSVSSAGVNSTGLNSGAVAYQAKFTTSDTPWQDWTGNLLAYPISASGNNAGTVNTLTPIWSAQSNLDTLASGAGWNTTRLIATCIPTSGLCGSGSGIPFRWTSLSSTQQSDLMTSTTDTLGPERLNYLRGDKSEEQQNSGPFRNRSHLLGDIVDSSPVYVAQASGPYITDTTYQSFETSTVNREPMLYVGANDGMLHAFDATTGEEKFAFVPNGVFNNLINLTNPIYNQQHRFFVDGSPTAGDVKFTNGAWHTILAGGLGAGGNSIYALDVTNPAGITNETQLAADVLWEFTDPNLGYTFSRPVIAETNISTTYSTIPFLVFFGSGYDNSASNDDYLYALNAQTGQEVTPHGKPIDLCTAVTPDPCSAAVPNGLSTATVVNSSGDEGVPVDTVYVGDLQGNLWKINILDPDPANWTVTLLFQAKDPSGNPQPITTAPVVSLSPKFPQVLYPMVFFGTGQLLGSPDISNTQVQTFYGIEDEETAGTAYTAPTRSDLIQQTLTDVTTTVCVDTGAPGNPPPCTSQTLSARLVSTHPVNLATNPGWFIDLGSAVSAADTGERVVADPRLVNGVIVFTTYIPAQSTCSAGGQSWLMALDYANGSSFPQPQLDLNGDGNLNGSDQVNGQNPVGLSLGTGYASAPAIISAPSGNDVKLVNKSTGQIQSIQERGGNTNRTWWQIY
ncbi:MAG: pilus assembly protein [Acidiferrobacterales bacterium]